MKSNARHWNRIFDKTEDGRLGWYEDNATPTLALMANIPELKSPRVFLLGAGTSVLIDSLLSKGARLIPIEALTQRLGGAFELVSHFDHTYFNPNGDPRPYIYALYRRIDG